MAAGFEFPRRGASSNATPADVWTPLVFTPSAQATAGLSALATRILDNYPAGLRTLKITMGTIPLTEELLGQVRRPLLILFGALGLVLLVTCANVANLILSRSLGRQRDIGVRAALGAGRLRLFQVLLSEVLILAASGGRSDSSSGIGACARSPRYSPRAFPA
jgi:hypothetical protein